MPIRSVLQFRSCWTLAVRSRAARSIAILVASLVGCAIFPPPPAAAIEVVIKGAAPDRIERQRAFNRDELPPPVALASGSLATRLKAAGQVLGDHVFIRVFKQESELEVWLRKGDRYELFATYPVCFWSGTLGPKQYEGDKQTPEGFYTVGRRQLRLVGRWPKSLNLWFPNIFDKAHKRTGSYILIHGGCSSVGCYALTDDVLDEVHLLTSRAIRRGKQRQVHVHAFPFRMTKANLARHADSEWAGFWRNLKGAYDLFEETRVPPQIGVCRKRYVYARATPQQAARMAVQSVRPRVSNPNAGRAEAKDPSQLYCRVPAEPDVTTEDVASSRETSLRLPTGSARAR